MVQPLDGIQGSCSGAWVDLVLLWGSPQDTGETSKVLRLTKCGLLAAVLWSVFVWPVS